MNIVIIGLSITSSWGNGHATTYRSLIRALGRRGHEVVFLERDVPWYAPHRDFSGLPRTRVALYQSLEELRRIHTPLIKEADAVILGSYVPDGIEVARWVLDQAGGVTAFYDIDTPVTLARMERGNCDYLTPELIPGFDLFLSFTGGGTLQRLENEFGSPRARAFHCSVDPELYHTEAQTKCWDMAYLGTYSKDRQPRLRQFLIEPALAWPDGRFMVAGPQYPAEIRWPGNVERLEHLAPDRHRAFYNSQRFTLNITRDDMIVAGHSPSVRLFEAAACGRPIISDRWEGLDTLFEISREILVVDHPAEVLQILREMPADEAERIGAAGRERVLACHTADHRAEELEAHLRSVQQAAAMPATV